MLCDRVQASGGRPLSFTLVQRLEVPQQWRRLLELIDAAQARGLPVRGQAAPRAIGLVLGLQATLHPFLTKPSYLAIAQLPLAERVARMRDPALRARILAEPIEALPGRIPDFIVNLLARLDRVFALGDPPDYELTSEASVAARAASLRCDPILAALYDVPTMRFNEAVKRNLAKFPVDFMFTLTAEEFAALRSQLAPSNAGGRGGRRYLPRVFTEHTAR